MAGAWRYTTWADCTRHWRWYDVVGPAQRTRALLPACGRAGALALPLLAGPAVAPPARVLAPLLPWIGLPDLYGGGAYAPGGPGFGFGDYGYAGGPVIAGSAAPALVPGGLPAVGTAFLGNQGPGTGAVMRAGQADVTLSGAPTGQPGGNATAGGSPALSATPQNVPEIPSFAVLLSGLTICLLWRRRE